MIHYLSWTASFPLVLTVCAVLSYALAGFGGGYVLWRVCRSLVACGHPVRRVTGFAIAFVAIAAPAAYLGHRVAAPMQPPFGPWSWDLLLQPPRIDASHGFHAATLLPLACLAALAWAWRFRLLQMLDTASLFLPIAHAIASVGCLLLACCWGETVRLGLPGFQATLVSPTPLYSIGLDLLVFALLGRMFRVAYQNVETQRRYEGIVFGAYLLLEGAARLVMESFPHQELVLWRLGRAQLLMAVLVAAGSAVLWLVHARSGSRSRDPGVDDATRLAMARLTSLLGVAVAYLLLVFVFHYLTRRTHILPTPFRRADSLGDAYTRVLFCVPLVVPAAAALFFLRRAGERARPFLRWPGVSPLFGLALLVSALYALAMLFLRGTSLPGWAYWPPVLILAAVNSVSEEVIHRLAVFRLLLASGVAEWASLGIQSALYSLVHFAISPSLGAMSLVYGLLLGLVMWRTRSLAACILCHFVIDLGGIGGPMLAG